jgi:sulfatase maturation enzyme AslB (radical SAM superfamily)
MNFPINYCALPFRGMQIECDGEIKSCCLYKPYLGENIKQYHITNYDHWWNESLTSLRNTVINNEIDPGCSYCLKPDVLPHPMRTGANQFFSSKPQYTPGESPEWLDIRFGNFCNLKCMMCTPNNSSQIEQEYNNNTAAYNALGIGHNTGWKRFSIEDRAASEENWWDNPDIFDHVVKIANKAKYVNFSGGEPLMMPQLYDLMDAMDPNCIITFNTNLTRVTARTLASIKRFKNVTLQVSLDGVGAHQEYIRWNSNWEELDRNIRTMCDLPNVRVTFSYLLQHTTIYTWPALWNYLKPFNREVLIMPVYDDTIGKGVLTHNSAVSSDVEKFAQWVAENPGPDDQAITHWLSAYQFSEATHREFRDYVGMLDNIRGGNFRATFNPAWD